MTAGPVENILGVAEAKARFSELIERVRHGERFLVARRGHPVLALVPPDQAAPTRSTPPGGAPAIAPLLTWTDHVLLRHRHSQRGTTARPPALAHPPSRAHAARGAIHHRGHPRRAALWSRQARQCHPDPEGLRTRYRRLAGPSLRRAGR